MTFKRLIIAGTATAVMAGAALAVSATGASAYVACNRDGDCWHTDKKVSAPGVRFDYHADDWYFHQKWEADKDHHYRDYHDGRGYYKGGIWVQL